MRSPSADDDAVAAAATSGAAEPPDENRYWAALAFHMASSFGRFEALPPPDGAAVVETPAVPVAPPISLSLPLGQILAERRSERRFGDAPLSCADIGAVLWAGYGRAAEPSGLERRTVPSAGGLYPLRLVLLATAVGDMPRGLYRAAAGLPPVPIETPPPETVGDWFHTHHVDYTRAAAVIFVVGRFDAICGKYGERGYRYLLLEAGHVGQNLCLAAAALGIPHVPVGGFDDDAVNAAICDPAGNEVALYSVVLGCR
jgi:SagB-type dehydrogenase family enzyme